MRFCGWRLVLLVPFFANCATQRNFVISSDSQNTQATLVGSDGQSKIAESVGALPQTIPEEKWGNRALQLSSPGKITQSWLLMPDTDSTEVRVVASMADHPPLAASGKVEKDQSNLIARLVLNSYRALTQGDFQESLTLAGKISELRPDLAAAHILTGLAQMQLGKAAEARSAFQTAKSLDPEDVAIDGLLKAVP